MNEQRPAIAMSWISQANGPGDLIIGMVLFLGSAVAYKPLQRLFVVFTPGAGASGAGSVSPLGTGAIGAATLASARAAGAAGGPPAAAAVRRPFFGKSAIYDDGMAGRARLIAALAVAALTVAACSDDEPEIVLSDITASSTTTQAPPPVVTTTTEATTTTLSEQALAEAEVAQLVIDWWLAPFDTSEGELGLEYLTGLVEIRIQEYAQQVEAEGQIARNQGQETIEVTGVKLDLDKGEGEVHVCAGSSGEVLDAETLEQIGEEDPEYLTTTLFYVERTGEGWKISELIPSLGSGEPEICEFKLQ